MDMHNGHMTLQTSETFMIEIHWTKNPAADLVADEWFKASFI